jgi:hypothetical protein
MDFTCLKSSKGAPLDILKDLHPGDSIQVLFTISIKISIVSRHIVSLVPKRIVKHVDA